MSKLTYWNIKIFYEIDIFILTGDGLMFIFQLSTLNSLVYKAFDIPSKGILDIYNVGDNLAIVGKKQIIYYSISKNNI